MAPLILWVAITPMLFALSTPSRAELGMPVPTGVGVRAAGIGGAYVAVADGAAGMFHNPAGLGVGTGVCFFGQTNVSGRGRVKLDPKGIAYQWRGWGIGWGNRIAQGVAGVADHTYVSGGHRLSSHVALGLSVKLWRTHPSTHFQVLGNSATYDLGVLVAPNGAARIGARVGQHERGRGIGHVVIGASRKVGFALLVAEAEWRDSGKRLVRVGAEVPAGSHVCVRGGWNRDRPTAGLGLEIGPASLDGAWSEVSGHRIISVSTEIRM